MRQTVEVMTCDACKAWKHDDNAEGVEAVTVAGGATLDLCGEHREGMRAVLALIAEWSRPAARASRVASKATPLSAVPSPTPGEGQGGGGKRTRRGGVKERARRESRSAVTTDELACPLCGHVSPTVGAAGMHLRDTHGLNTSVVYGSVCPLCAHEGTARGLGVHAGKAHGLEGVAAVFARARAEGDKHGVIARRMDELARTVARQPATVDEAERTA